MVAPIITFVLAALLGFLTWKTSTIEPYMPAEQGGRLAESPAAPAPETEEEATDED